MIGGIIIKDRLLKLEENIQKSLIRAGREGDPVEVIAVTKTIDIDRIEEVLKLGYRNIGENKVQELENKYMVLPKDTNIHMIGHLQTNKVRNIIGKVKLVHSLDRISLAQELDKRSRMNNLITNVLVQVNIAEEETKFGLRQDEVLKFIEESLLFENIRIKGLMTMAPYTEDEKLLRHVFKSMTNLKENILKRNYKNLDMDYLSMGMTNDYEIAIEEGSNMIRIGSFIFGSRE